MSQSVAQLAKSASLISIATMLSRILGLVREQLIAFMFSRTATDAFYVAFRIPNLLRDLFAEGAMSSAFVPTFTEYLRKRSIEDAWRLASIVINFLFVILSTVTILGILYSDRIVSMFAGEFRSEPGKFELTVQLTQIMFPFLPLVALAAIAMGILNSHGNFFIPALAPALFNVGSIIVAPSLYYWFLHHGWDPILGMAIGTLTGGLLQLLAQIPPLLRKGFTYSLDFSWGHPGVQRIFLLMGPGMIGLASTQINIFVNTWLATSQGEGPVSWLNYAFRLMQFPLGIFGVAIATAALPTISAQIATNETELVTQTLSTSLRMVMMVNIPASLGLISLSHPIIAIIYQHGRFKESDAVSTSNALIFYAIGLFAYSSIKVVVPVFYAFGRSRVPVLISTFIVGLNIALNLILIHPLGYLGLALGTSLASFINMFLLLYWLQTYFVQMDIRELAKSFLKILIASIAMGITCFFFHSWLYSFSLTGSIAWRFTVLSCSIVVGLLSLSLSCKVLRVREFNSALQIFSKRLGFD